MISIIITTYNRIHLVSDAINSALEFLEPPLYGEIIIVDDSSQDGTFTHLAKKYYKEIENGHIKIVQHIQNRGVTAAKNTGASMATQDWILFLDSDDKLIQGNREGLLETLRQTEQYIPVVFFRCIDATGQPIGIKIEKEIFPNLSDYIKYGTYGESLPVLRTQPFIKNAYREDLRGFEGLTYCKLIKQYGQFMISPLAVRIYETDGADRLSSRFNLLKRGCLLAKGYMSLLVDYRKDISMGSITIISYKIFINMVRCLMGRFIYFWSTNPSRQ